MGPRFLRFATLVAAGCLAAFWTYVAGASVAETLPLAKDVRLGLYGMLLLVLLVVPAFAFAVSNVAINLAAVLMGAAVAISAYTGLVYLPKPSAMLLLLSVALLTVLFGTYFLFRSDEHAPELPFEQANLRVMTLLGAGAGTVLWLTAFAPVIERWGDPRATGFHVIPAFYGTIFFLAFVIPLFVMGLRGSQEKKRGTVTVLLSLVALSLVVFGLPQLLPTAMG